MEIHKRSIVSTILHRGAVVMAGGLTMALLFSVDGSIAQASMSAAEEAEMMDSAHRWQQIAACLNDPNMCEPAGPPRPAETADEVGDYVELIDDLEEASEHVQDRIDEALSSGHEPGLGAGESGSGSSGEAGSSNGASSADPAQDMDVKAPVEGDGSEEVSTEVESAVRHLVSRLRDAHSLFVAHTQRIGDVACFAAEGCPRPGSLHVIINFKLDHEGRTFDLMAVVNRAGWP